MLDIDAVEATRSFEACGSPDTWKAAADVENIGTEVGKFNSDHRPISAERSLDYLCSRFDPGDSTATCKARPPTRLPGQ